MSRATIGVPMKSMVWRTPASSSVTTSLVTASSSMSTTGRVMPMMAGAKPTRLRPGASGSSAQSKPGSPRRPSPGWPVSVSAESDEPRAARLADRRVSPRVSTATPPAPASTLARSPSTARASPRPAARAGARCLRAHPEQGEVVGGLRHPLVDESRQDRAGHDDRRDGDDDAEDQGAAEVGVRAGRWRSAARGAAAPARAAPTGRRAPGCRPSSATPRCAGRRG